MEFTKKQKLYLLNIVEDIAAFDDLLNEWREELEIKE